MRYRALGNTGLMVSEIGLGAEWLERHNAEEVKAVIDCCEEQGINILDCWMPEGHRREAGAVDHPGALRLHLAERPVCPHPGHGQGKARL